MFASLFSALSIALAVDSTGSCVELRDVYATDYDRTVIESLVAAEDEALSACCRIEWTTDDAAFRENGRITVDVDVRVDEWAQVVRYLVGGHDHPRFFAYALGQMSEEEARGSRGPSGACVADVLKALPYPACPHARSACVLDIRVDLLDVRSCAEGSPYGCERALTDARRLAAGGKRAEARSLLKAGCEAEHAGSCLGLGWIGIDEEFVEAWPFERACDLGERLGCFHGAVARALQGGEAGARAATDLLTRGCGVDDSACRNMAPATLLARSAAATLRGDREGWLGLLDPRRYPAPIDDPARRADRAVRLGEAACNLGERAGCTIAAESILTGNNEGAQAKAKAFYAAGCALSDGLACTRAGELAEGSEADAHFAAARLALDAGCTRSEPGACRELGRLLREGRGGAPEPERADGLLRSACNAGDLDACKLGEIEPPLRARSRLLAAPMQMSLAVANGSCFHGDEVDFPGQCQDGGGTPSSDAGGRSRCVSGGGELLVTFGPGAVRQSQLVAQDITVTCAWDAYDPTVPLRPPDRLELRQGAATIQLTTYPTGRMRSYASAVRNGLTVAMFFNATGEIEDVLCAAPVETVLSTPWEPADWRQELELWKADDHRVWRYPGEAPITPQLATCLPG